MLVFKQEKLPYGYDELTRFIDSKTMKTHYEKHHRGYVNKLNNALERFGLPEDTSLTYLFAHMDKYNLQVRNNAGGHYNHMLFWRILSPKEQTLSPKSVLGQAIKKRFGSEALFRERFSELAARHFGSGWAWLSVDRQGILQVSSTPNQDNPLMCVCSQQGTPILGLDLWEHAYYLKYLNNRQAYIDAFWSVVNWREVERIYLHILNKSNA